MALRQRRGGPAIHPTGAAAQLTEMCFEVFLNLIRRRNKKIEILEL